VKKMLLVTRCMFLLEMAIIRLYVNIKT
jgi:hypothetical protein